MNEWIRKRIYDVSKSIADKLQTVPELAEADKARMQRNLNEFSKAPDIIKGESPWKIVTSKVGAYSVCVYNYMNGRWEDIIDCSDKVLGVKESEIRRVMTEKFGAVSFKNDYDRYVAFETVEEAQIFVDDIKGYYDEYHMPKAMMERMMCYAEGSYPPYFKNHKRCPSEDEFDKEMQRRNEERLKKVPTV